MALSATPKLLLLILLHMLQCNASEPLMKFPLLFIDEIPFMHRDSELTLRMNPPEAGEIVIPQVRIFASNHCESQ